MSNGQKLINANVKTKGIFAKDLFVFFFVFFLLLVSTLGTRHIVSTIANAIESLRYTHTIFFACSVARDSLSPLTAVGHGDGFLLSTIRWLWGEREREKEMETASQRDG